MVSFSGVNVFLPFYLLLASRVSVPWVSPQNKGYRPVDSLHLLHGLFFPEKMTRIYESLYTVNGVPSTHSTLLLCFCGGRYRECSAVNTSASINHHEHGRGVVRGFESREGKSLLCLEGKCRAYPFRSVYWMRRKFSSLLLPSPIPFLFLFPF